MSALSYLLSRVELMVKAPPVPSSLTDTLLVYGGAALDFLLLPVELSGTSSTVAQLQRGALAGVGARGLVGLLLPSQGFSGKSKCLGGSCYNCFPVELVGAN